MGGDDIIDGDKWLDVRIGVWADGAPHTGIPPRVVASMKDLTTEMFNGTTKAGQLGIVRQIVSTADAVPDIDVAVFSEERANYSITMGPAGASSSATSRARCLTVRTR